MKSLLLSAVAILFSAISFGQSQGVVFAEDSTLPVKRGSLTYQLPWSGGTSTPEPCMADLNKDGLLDLVIYEYSTSEVKTFINRGTAGFPIYQYQPKYAKNFPGYNGNGIYSFMIMEDYNRDGIADIFDGGGAGMNIYRGYYNANNELSFDFFKTIYYQSPAFGRINLYTQYKDIPGIADIDGDGDLDVLAFEVTGSFISYFKNCQVEHNLPKDSFEVCNPSRCWGGVVQGFAKPFRIGDTVGCSAQGTFNCKTTGHGNNTICLLDIDGDGDMDILDGNANFNDIQLLKNGKMETANTRDTIISQEVQWQANGQKLVLDSYPAASWVDIDADGKRDILIAPHEPTIAENVNNFVFYKNTGTNTSPVYTFQSNNHIVKEMLEHGTGSYPIFYDYNKDGRMDMIVGSDGYYDGSGNFKSKLTYYQNLIDVTGSGKPTLYLLNSDLAGVAGQGFAGAAPAIGDLDNDGKDDLVLGHTDGTLSFYKNMAANNNITPNWQLNQLILKNDTGGNVEVSYYAAPFIYDLDGDGAKDLLIGHQEGTVYYYKNGGQSGQVSLKYITNKLGNMQANSGSPFSGFSAPYVGRVDNTTQDYILLGNDLGQINKYTGFQNASPTSTYALLDTFYSFIKHGKRSTVAIGDLRGEGKMDMVVGNTHGGLNLYRQVKNVGIETVNVNGFSTNLYPNPASNGITLAWEGGIQTAANYTIFDATGRVVVKSTIPKGSNQLYIALPSLSAGMYQCMVEGDGLRDVKKFIVLQP